MTDFQVQVRDRMGMLTTATLRVIEDKPSAQLRDLMTQATEQHAEVGALLPHLFEIVLRAIEESEQALEEMALEKQVMLERHNELQKLYNLLVKR